MNLNLTLVGERSVYQQYGAAKTEQYTVAQAEIDGESRFIAQALRALADSIDPEESR